MGQPLRTRVRNDPAGRFLIVQMKDVSITQGIIPSRLSRINLKSNSFPRLLRRGDILFTSRSWRKTAPFSILVEEDLDNLIAAPLFYIIRVKDKSLRPEYLNWYINSDIFGRKFFMRNAMGSGVLNVPKSILGKMEIIVPPLKAQDTLIGLMALLDGERRAMRLLSEKRNKLINSIIKNFIEKKGAKI